jgi:gas vesicle protein
MARQDTSDFLTAFAVGTVLGIGATLLLRPEPRSPRERLLRELKPYRKQLKKSAARVGRELRDSALAGDATGDAIDAGRELLAEFRDEVRRIIEEARDELRDAMEERASGPRSRGRASLLDDEEDDDNFVIGDFDEDDLDDEDLDEEEFGDGDLDDEDLGDDDGDEAEGRRA